MEGLFDETGFAFARAFGGEEISTNSTAIGFEELLCDKSLYEFERSSQNSSKWRVTEIAATAIHKPGGSVCRLHALSGIGVLSATDCVILVKKNAECSSQNSELPQRILTGIQY